MIPSTLSERARYLRDHGEPFVTATVVRTQRPTSAQAGNVALVHRDGTIEGFVGGVCAQHSVRLYSLQVIETGEPLLLRIMPDGDEAARAAAVEQECLIADDGGTSLSGEEVGREDGTVTVRNPCLSGGAVELFLEPELPAPRVLIVGESPIVGALKTLGPAVGLDLIAGVDRTDGSVAPRPGDLALIVAAHGRGEVEALIAGVRAELPYVGLVASPKRGAAVLADLRAEGVSDELIDSPAGLDIGARTAAEIALSILAQVISVRRGYELPAAVVNRRPASSVTPPPAHDFTLGVVVSDTPAPNGAVAPATPATPASERPLTSVTPQMAIDPVCGMTVVVVPGTPSSSVGGEPEYFCCESCKLAFEREHRAG